MASSAGAYVTIAGWEAGVAALRDSRPIKHLLLDLAFNKNEEVSFAGTTIKVAEMELVAAGLPTSRIQEVYGAFLVSLDLSRCMISSRGAEVLGAAIIANDTLRKIWLNSNPIGPTGCRAIALALESNDTLMSINLSNCELTRGKRIGVDDMDREKYQVDMTGIEALAKMISINSSLTRLNFAKNALGSEGFEILLPSIKHNKVLRSVSLAMNCKSSDAALFVARCLKGTRTLAKIDLKSNTLGQLGAQTLEMALKQNQSLTHLNIRNTGVNLAALKHIVGPLHVSNLLTVDLSYNSIGPEGCKLMSSALAKCSITALNLSNCYLTSRATDMSGVKAIAAALVDNRSIAALDLSSNGLIKTSFRSRDNRDDDYSAVFALADALTHNQVIVRLDLSSNGIKKRGQLPFVNALETSPYGLRFAVHVQRILEGWFNGLVKASAKRKGGASRYEAATIMDTRKRMLMFVFANLREERQILF